MARLSCEAFRSGRAQLPPASEIVSFDENGVSEEVSEECASASLGVPGISLFTGVPVVAVDPAVVPVVPPAEAQTQEELDAEAEAGIPDVAAKTVAPDAAKTVADAPPVAPFAAMSVENGATSKVQEQLAAIRKAVKLPVKPKRTGK